jgi:predicted RNA methylase
MENEMKTIYLSAEARAVLEKATIEPLYLMLPGGQLDRKLYVEIDAFLKAKGGKWNRRHQGHYFAAGTDGLAAAITAGSVEDKKKSYEQFFTPADLAGKLVAMIDIQAGHSVLEPSAGNGRLIWEALERGASVTAVEVDPDLYSGLFAEKGRYPRLDPVCADFMAIPAPPFKFDRVIMNPPFSKGQDMAHVRRAYDLLKPGGRLGAIMSPHWTFASDRQSQEFRRWVDECAGVWTENSAGSFRESGTGVNTGILIIDKPEA